jgi:hypothetical protein
MQTRFSLKSIVFWGVVIGVGYYLMGHHIVFFGWEPKTLKKAKFTFEDTFTSTTGMNNHQILSNETLRKAGLGTLLVEMGKISEAELENLMSQFKE